MRFDAIVVPQGAESRAVGMGWPAARPVLHAVPVGRAAGPALAAAPIAGTTALVLGVCGALDPALCIGDAVVYARIIDGDATIELDAELTAHCALACERAPATAAAVTSVVGEPAAKAALRQATGAAVIDMEASSLAAALHRRGMRVAMVRVVSDDAAHALPNLQDVYGPGGSLRPAALTVALLRSPGRSLRFVRNALRALRALRAIARRLAESSTQ